MGCRTYELYSLQPRIYSATTSAVLSTFIFPRRDVARLAALHVFELLSHYVIDSSLPFLASACISATTKKKKLCMDKRKRSLEFPAREVVNWITTASIQMGDLAASKILRRLVQRWNYLPVLPVE